MWQITAYLRFKKKNTVKPRALMKACFNSVQNARELFSHTSKKLLHAFTFLEDKLYTSPVSGLLAAISNKLINFL